MMFFKDKIKLVFAFVLLTFLFVKADVMAQMAGSAEIDSAINQSAGDNPVQNLDFITAYGMQQKAWNNPLQHMGEGQSRPGYSKYSWRSDLVLPLRLREGMMTLINFPNWEVIEEIWVGSSEAFFADIASPNSVMLSVDPSAIGVDGNMIVFGRSGNRYAFYLRSEGYNTERITHSLVDIVVNDANTPEGVLVSASGGSTRGKRAGAATVATGTATNAPINWLENIPVNPETFRFDIDVYVPNPEDVAWAPDRVWRDDIFTYIDLGKRALNTNERPIVNLLVQETEVPVGFRTRGPHGRLIIVEAIGDMVLRNGRRMICLKLRKDPSYGLDLVEYYPKPSGPVDTGGGYRGEIPVSDPFSPPPPLPAPSAARAEMNSVSMSASSAGSKAIYDDYKKTDTMNYLYTDQDKSYGDAYSISNIALELGTSDDIKELERLWDDIYKDNPKALIGLEPYFSVDAKVGDNKEVFHLRAGPIKEIALGEHICVVLGKSGLKCSVIRTE